MTFETCMADLRRGLPASDADLPTHPSFRDVSFGDLVFDESYVRSDRGEFDTAESRIAAQSDFIEAALGLAAGSTLLDSGCGIGTYSHELARRGHRVVGVDLSRTFLERARLSMGQRRAGFVRGSYRSMPFRACFDAVIQTAAMFCCDSADLVQISSEAKSCLPSGGRFLFDYSNWPVRCRGDSPRETEWWEDLDSFVLQRTDWSVADRTQHSEWYRVTPGRSLVFRNQFTAQLLSPGQAVDAVRSAGFRHIDLVAKWDLSGRPPGGVLRTFDGESDRGFVLVGTA